MALFQRINLTHTNTVCNLHQSMINMSRLVVFKGNIDSFNETLTGTWFERRTMRKSEIWIWYISTLSSSFEYAWMGMRRTDLKHFQAKWLSYTWWCHDVYSSVTASQFLSTQNLRPTSMSLDTIAYMPHFQCHSYHLQSPQRNRCRTGHLSIHKILCIFFNEILLNSHPQLIMFICVLLFHPMNDMKHIQFYSYHWLISCPQLPRWL